MCLYVDVNIGLDEAHWNLTQDSSQALRTAILEITKGKKPETVEQLTRQVHDQFPSFSNQQILDQILILQNEDKIRLTQAEPLPAGFMDFLRTNTALWYWVTVFTTLAAVLSVFSIPENAYPLVYIRYVLGAIFILWLPGYAFMKALFPNYLPFTAGLTRTPGTSARNLDTLERVVLSIGLSLALVPIVGLLLNYTPWGIRLTPVTLSLAALTFVFSTAAIIREYQSIQSAQGHKTPSEAV